MNSKNVNNVVIFDGDCVFCNSWAKYILQKDKSESIYVTASSSLKAKLLFEKMKIKESPEHTIIYVSINKYYSYSSAILQIGFDMKGLHKLLILGFLVPKFIRDSCYRFIAKKRNALLSKSCSIDQMINHPRYLA